jgi:hypothetical protein
MTCLKSTLPASGTAPAVLMLTLPVTTQALLELGLAFAGTAPAHAAHQPDAADIEYASWMSDPGAIEVASWGAHMRSPGR